jgi:hypothetical protein
MLQLQKELEHVLQEQKQAAAQGVTRSQKAGADTQLRLEQESRCAPVKLCFCQMVLSVVC